ncbi:hypothetical protein NM208_g4504 [Fusarium decemcellulare]|uniref:Uncharacterized protein n=1 Tax=Fusarium decemcellulare TaxID=57161 RepID=A0ACC1SKW4_9HYPO|nr:hypothetical protein NM208_g4504 [Fusarium decemcellulare]
MALKVIIIRAGVGGLATAAILRDNAEVVLLERGDEERISGGQGLGLGPNATKILDSLGYDRVRSRAVTSKGIKAYDTATGDLVEKISMDMVQQYGADWLMTLRKDFRTELLRLATEQRYGHGVTPTIRYNCRVVDIDVHDGEVELQGGQILEADLIVLASGIHSDLKDRILGSNRFVATPTGQSIFRFLVSAENATKAAGKLPEWWNPDVGAYLSIMRTNDDTNRALITYPCRDFKYVNFSCAFPNHLLRERAEESWLADGDHDEVMEIFKDFPTPYSTFMKFGNYAITTLYPLMCEVARSSSAMRRMPWLPSKAKAGPKPIEDAEGFRLLADAGVSRQDVPAILKRWDQARRPRASQVQEHTRQASRKLNEKDSMNNMAYNWSYDSILKTLKALKG